MNNRLYKTVKALINTDGNGNFNPEEYDLIVYNVVMEKFEELFSVINRFVNKKNRGMLGNGMENIVDNSREKLSYYSNQKATLAYDTGVFNLPQDLMYIESINYKNSSIDLIKSVSNFELLKEDGVSIDYPICIKREGSIEVFPAEIIDEVTVSYLRTPRKNKWTYLSIGGTEVFNPSATDFQDIDIHPSEESDLVMKVLMRFGINLKDQEIKQAVAAQISQDFNEKNAN